MQLGAFSVSHAVQDLGRSTEFYEKLGFSVMGGDATHGFLILRNGQTVIGLFEGMFEGQMLTFNPGWDQTASEVDPFEDVRDLKARLRAAGIEVTQEQGGDTGPGSFVVVDPDGLPILIDQHR